jgi:hypothetical protein
MVKNRTGGMREPSQQSSCVAQKKVGLICNGNTTSHVMGLLVDATEPMGKARADFERSWEGGVGSVGYTAQSIRLAKKAVCSPAMRKDPPALLTRRWRRPISHYEVQDLSACDVPRPVFFCNSSIRFDASAPVIGSSPVTHSSGSFDMLLLSASC